MAKKRVENNAQENLDFEKGEGIDPFFDYPLVNQPSVLKPKGFLTSVNFWHLMVDRRYNFVRDVVPLFEQAYAQNLTFKDEHGADVPCVSCFYYRARNNYLIKADKRAIRAFIGAFGQNLVLKRSVVAVLEAGENSKEPSYLFQELIERSQKLFMEAPHARQVEKILEQMYYEKVSFEDETGQKKPIVIVKRGSYFPYRVLKSELALQAFFKHLETELFFKRVDAERMVDSNAQTHLSNARDLAMFFANALFVQDFKAELANLYELGATYTNLQGQKKPLVLVKKSSVSSNKNSYYIEGVYEAYLQFFNAVKEKYSLSDESLKDFEKYRTLAPVSWLSAREIALDLSQKPLDYERVKKALQQAYESGATFVDADGLEQQLVRFAYVYYTRNYYLNPSIEGVNHFRKKYLQKSESSVALSMPFVPLNPKEKHNIVEANEFESVRTSHEMRVFYLNALKWAYMHGITYQDKQGNTKPLAVFGHINQSTRPRFFLNGGDDAFNALLKRFHLAKYHKSLKAVHAEKEEVLAKPEGAILFGDLFARTKFGEKALEIAQGLDKKGQMFTNSFGKKELLFQRFVSGTHVATFLSADPKALEFLENLLAPQVLDGYSLVLGLVCHSNKKSQMLSACEIKESMEAVCSVEFIHRLLAELYQNRVMFQDALGQSHLLVMPYSTTRGVRFRLNKCKEARRDFVDCAYAKLRFNNGLTKNEVMQIFVPEIAPLEDEKVPLPQLLFMPNLVQPFERVRRAPDKTPEHMKHTAFFKLLKLQAKYVSDIILKLYEQAYQEGACYVENGVVKPLIEVVYFSRSHRLMLAPSPVAKMLFYKHYAQKLVTKDITKKRIYSAFYDRVKSYYAHRIKE